MLRYNLCHSCGSRNPFLEGWIPIFMGMTRNNSTPTTMVGVVFLPALIKMVF